MRFLLSVLLVLSATLAASAAEFTFNVDPLQSSIRFSLETVEGEQFSSAQTPGSDTTSLSGTMSVDLTGGTIQFLPNANIQFAQQSLPQAPLLNGSLGSAPAQYGLSLLLPGVGSGVVAARNYVGEATSGPINLAGTSFDSTQVSLDLPSGTTSYNLVLFNFPVSGTFTANHSAPSELSGGSLTQVGNLYVLTLPILIHGEVSVSGVEVVNVYEGQIVATALVPEPNSLALAGLGCVMLVANYYRRARRHSRAV